MAALAAAERIARSNPVYQNTLISEDARFTTVTVRVTPTGLEPQADALPGPGDAGGAARGAPARSVSGISPRGGVS